jgi:hypothetical protein
MAKGTFKVGGMAHMAECLPSKHKVLSSNPNTTKKKKKKEWGRHTGRDFADVIQFRIFEAGRLEWLI